MVFVDDWNTSDLEFTHDLVRVPKGRIVEQRDRIEDHAAFRTLYLSNLLSLRFQGHIFMDYSNTTFLSHSDGQLKFRHRVHSS
ncbi:hypothetical protein D3C87_1598430 [compost metagenome]